MNKDSILFAMANPVPEIMPELALAAGAKVVATGRSDFPNQINNLLVFPGIFKGALAARASRITEEMMIAAAYAIAGRVSPEELALIEQKMSQLGTKNREAYLRKMALDGYVVQLDLPELKELVSLLRRSSNNLNQLTRRVHETGRVYDADLEDIAQRQEQLWEGVKEILTQLSNLS